MIQKIILVVIFFIGLVYIAWPIKGSIDNIPALPGALKSKEPGDTHQNPNISAYFSDFRRKYIIDFYRDDFEQLTILGVKIPAIKLNHPPEEAYLYIRDQQQSMYLEQFIYPMREALYVNGIEPFNDKGKPFYQGITHIKVDGTVYNTKTTLRYYPSGLFDRVMTYLLTCAAGYALYILFRRSLKETI